MANIQIPNLPAVAALSGAELLEAVQAGSSVKVSLNQLNALFRIGPVSFPLAVNIGGTGTTTSTGTGSVVLSDGPTLVNPTFVGPSINIGTFGLGTVSAPSITFTGDLNTGIWSPGADTVAVSTNGVERIRINSTGLVGIGTNNPTSLLDLYSATSSTLNVSGNSAVSILASRASTDATAANLNFRKYRGTIASPAVVVANDVVGSSNYSAFDGSGLVDVAQLQVGVEAISVPNDVSGYFRLFTRPAGTLSTLTERMRITAAGNVGIGTATPSGRLHVEAGSVTQNLIAPTGNGTFRMADSPTGVNRKEFTIILDNANNRVDMQAVQQGVASRNITLNAGGGNVGIGVAVPTFALQVETNADASAGSFIRNSNTGTSAFGNLSVASGVGSISVRAYSAASSAFPNSTVITSESGFTGGLNIFQAGANPIRLWTNSSERMRIHASGGVSIGNTTDPGNTNLSVTGTGSFGLGTALLPSYTFNGDLNTGMWSPAADTIAFSTAGSERYRIGSAGQLGIAGANFGTAGQVVISGGPSAAPAWGQVSLTAGVTGTLPLANGGTGATSAPAAAAVLLGYTATATAAGTTVLDNTSSQYQLFTGVTTQTITLPVTSTLTTGWSFHIVNNSTGNLTLNSSGGNLVATIIPGTTVMVTCILTSGTTAASWEFGYTDFGTLTGTGSVVMSDGATAAFALGAVGTPSITFTGDLNTGIWSPAADTVAVSTNGAERMRITSAGDITQLNATSGNGAIVGEQTFRLAADVTAFGPTIGDFFGPTSAISLEASSVYEVTIYAVFTKTTAGTATFTLTASSAPTRMVGSYQASPITGIAAGADTSGFAGSQGATTAAFAATGSLTTAVNHAYQFRVQLQTSAATNFRLQLTQSAGTATPLAGSYYTVKKISATTGTFV